MAASSSRTRVRIRRSAFSKRGYACQDDQRCTSTVTTGPSSAIRSYWVYLRRSSAYPIAISSPVRGSGTGFVAVASSRRAMIGRAVTLDSGKVQTGMVRVADAEVDAEARHANLWDDLPPTPFKLGGDRLLER